MRAAIVVVSVLVTGDVAYADPDTPRTDDDCGSSIYVEASGFLAASTAGVAELDRAAVGYLHRGCGSDVHVRLGATGHVRLGRLGFGPYSGGGGSHRIGARLGLEKYDGDLVTLGLRWRAGHFSIGADVFTAMTDDYIAGTNPAQYQRSVAPGVMVGAGTDGHVSGYPALAVLGGVIAVLFVGLVVGVAAASG